MKRFASLEDFWPFYVAQHGRRVTRAMHFAGTTLGLGLAAAGAARGRPFYLLCALGASYGLAWIGHFFFERNRPATFEYPWLSFKADFRMYRLMWRGRMDDEVRRLGLEGRGQSSKT